MKRLAPRILLLAIIFIMAGCAIMITPESAHAADPNAGLTKDQVILYRIAGIQQKADAAYKALDVAKQETKSVQAQYDTAVGQRDWWKADDEKHIAGETYWRKRAQVILYAFALSLGAWFWREANKMIVSPVAGWEGLVIPVLAFVIGSALGYTFGLYALGWASTFLP